MNCTDEIHSFAREFITDKSTRTIYRKKRISITYKELTGKVLRPSCSTCYIEALLYIINNTKMATFNYRLKKGYIAQFDIAFKGIKAFSNEQMTDELAQEYLKRYPSRAIYFEKLSDPGVVTSSPGIKIVEPPKKKVVAADENPETKVINPVRDILKEATNTLVEEEEKDEKTVVKNKLNELGVKYHPATGIEKLKKLLDKAQNSDE